MKDVEVKTIDIEGEDYFLVDIIDKYYFWTNVDNSKDIVIFKEEGDNLISLNKNSEIDSALALFYEKHKDVVMEENAD